MHFSKLLCVIATLGNTAMASAVVIDATIDSSQSPIVKICAQDNSGACLASNFDAALTLAENGDAPTVNLLYAAMVGCRNIAIANFSTKSAPSNNGHHVTEASDLNVQSSSDAKNSEVLSRHLQEKQASCANFSDAQLASLSELEAQAVNNGNSQAIANMYHHLRAGDGSVSLTRAQFISAVEQNANLEHPFNLYLLSKDIFSRRPFAYKFQKKAYAFGVAYTKAEKEESRRAPIDLVKLSTNLSPAEKSEAENAASAATSW